MRYVKYAFLAVIAIVLVTLALANEATVSLNTLPPALVDAPFVGQLAYTVELPMFVVILGSVVAGLLIGFVWEWLREARYRREAARKGAEARAMERELRRVKKRAAKEQDDDVLALLEDAR